MNNDTLHPENRAKPANSTLLLHFLATFVAVTVIGISAMMMALELGMNTGTGESVPRSAMILWGIGGLSFIPCTLLLVALVGTHKRAVGAALAVAIALAGILTAIGWFVSSEWQLPATSTERVVLACVIVVPLIAAFLILRASQSLRS